MNRRVSAYSRASVLIGALLCLLPISPALAATITVNSTADSTVSGSVCVLRDAILAANTNVAQHGCVHGDAGPTVDTIAFAIPPLDGTVKTINPLTALPTFTERVIVDGYTQNGATVNTLPSGSNANLTVVIDGNGLGSGLSGLIIGSGASGSTIRGLVVMRFPFNGISISASSNNLILGNFVGTNAAGNTAMGNGAQNFQGGVQIIASAAGQVANDNQIGSAIAADRNLIGGNLGPGVSIYAFSGGTGTGNVVAGNLIGSDKSGVSGLGNNGRGVTVQGASNSTIGLTTGTTPGGACSGGCNLISGNFLQIDFSNNDTVGLGTTVVQSNMVGPDISGNVELPSPFPNNLYGITVTSSKGTLLRIGGSGSAARNVFSANDQYGIDIENAGASPGVPILIQGNYIGSNAAGSAALPNKGDGINVQNTDGLSILGNLVSGNTGNGILLTGARSTAVQGNLIGTQANGSAALGNGRSGILLTFGFSNAPDNNIIGALNSGDATGNTIAFNDESNAFSGAGIQINSGVHNRISTNSIYSNGGTPTGLGIDLGGDGVTVNDTGGACDADIGANDLQNYVENVGYYTAAGVSHVTGVLRSAASTSYTLEFYASPGADPTGYGEGKTYVGNATVVTGAAPACAVAFDATTTSLIGANSVVSVLAIDPLGNTSEFSRALDRIFADGFNGL